MTTLDPTLLPLHEAISSWDARQRNSTIWSDERLTELARPSFARQFRQNDAFRSLCERRGITPDQLTSWRQIPAVPTDAFKVTRMSCVSEEQAARVFLTSGTTLATRGRHAFGTTALYEAALEKSFQRFCLPDRDQIRMLVIAPSATAMPESSLSFMLSALMATHGAPGSDYFVTRDASGELRYALDALMQALDEAQGSDTPVMILSTAFGLMELFDASGERRWQLPEGSRLMETGGFKGRSREVSRDELYELFQKRLGLPRSHCVSEYSMTELSSQAYTGGILNHYLGLNEHDQRFVPPPWVKFQVVDPLTLTPIDAAGEVGLVRWVDLANVESALVIQTSDRGRIDAAGQLTLLGRAPDSELRGCSLTIEEILEASQGRS